MAIVYTQALDLQQNKVTNVGSPTANGDAANKQYVDAIASGLVWKETARVAASSNVSLSSPGQIDGVTLQSGDRVLLFGQTNGADNGIYVYNGSALVRAQDADTSAEVKPGTAISVAEGTALADRTYVLITNAPITLGTTVLTFTLMNAAASVNYTAGNGIDITNNVVTAKAAAAGGIAVTTGGIGVVSDPAGGLSVGASGVGVRLDTNSGLAVSATGVKFVPKTNSGLATDAGGASVLVKPSAGLSTDATGLQVVAGNGVVLGASGVAVKPATNAGIVVDTNGVAVKAGTGIIVDTNGVSVDAAVVTRKFTASVGDGSATSITLTHNLNTRDVDVTLYSASAPYDTQYAEVQRPTVNTVQLVFGTAPSSGQLRAVVVG